MILSSLVSCRNTSPQPLSKADIAYLTYRNSDSKTSIGFIGLDGSIEFSEAGRFSMPTWSLDGKRLYVTVRSGQPYASGYPGYIDSSGELKQCNSVPQWFGQNLVVDIPDIGNINRVLTVAPDKIMIIDIEKCETISVLVDVSQKGEMNINGASYTVDGKWLVYGLGTYRSGGNQAYQLMKLDLDTQQTSVLANGINPTWSPDGMQIAYVQYDGIYIMNSDGSDARRLISQNFIYSDRGFLVTSPIPRWSPDGKWLIYHRCTGISCLVDENTIYKVEISTGKEEKVADEGAYPDWKASNP